MQGDIRIPDIEIIVGAAGNDICVLCFYKREDIHHGYEVVAAICGKNEVAIVRKVLQDAITSLDTADWHTLDELHQDASSGEEAPPF